MVWTGRWGESVTDAPRGDGDGAGVDPGGDEETEREREREYVVGDGAEGAKVTKVKGHHWY